MVSLQIYQSENTYVRQTFMNENKDGLKRSIDRTAEEMFLHNRENEVCIS